MLGPANCLQRADAFFFEAAREIAIYGTRKLLLVPKEKSENTPTIAEEPVFTFVLDATNFNMRHRIDLNSLKDKILDWGGVTASKDVAMQWQVSYEAGRESDKVLAHFLRNNKKKEQ